MRTTIRINDAVLVSAKKEAASRNISLTKLIEEALQEKLYSRGGRSKGKKVNLPTTGGNGLQPGVDIDNSALLIDVMEG